MGCKDYVNNLKTEVEKLNDQLDEKDQRIEELEAILPSAQALEVFAKAKEQHGGDLPFDGKLIPNQWLLNERATSGKLGAMVDDLEKYIEELEGERKALRGFIADLQQLASETTALSNDAVERWCKQTLEDG